MKDNFTEGTHNFIYIPDDVEGGRVTASADEYNDEWFYTEVLNWNPYFWDFDSLIVTADIMPTHK